MSSNGSSPPQAVTLKGPIPGARTGTPSGSAGGPTPPKAGSAARQQSASIRLELLGPEPWTWGDPLGVVLE
jgi:hypothetical protein